MNKLTEREQYYLNEWITYQEERPIKALLITSWSVAIIALLLFGGICFYFKDEDMLVNLGLMGIPVGLAVFLACFTVLLLKRLKKHRTYVYDEIKRTKILSKEVVYWVNGKGRKMPAYCYRCKGIKGEITPVSKKYYDMAKVGDDITVVQTSMKCIAIGITFGADGL